VEAFFEVKISLQATQIIHLPLKSSSEKSSAPTSTPATQAVEKPFFPKAGEGDFFKPAGSGAPAVQAKMTVNKPGDKFEQEADKMADKVMRMPDPAPATTSKEEKIQRAPDEKVQKRVDDRIMRAEMKDDKVQKAEAKEEKIQKAEMKEDKVQKAEAKEDKIQKAEVKEEKVQRKDGSDGSSSSVGTHTQSAIQSKAGGGQPLSSDVRSHMEPRFHADFSNIRIHNDPESASLSNHLGARAFTYQNNIFFSRDQYQPGTSEGKQLLAHELTHTIQQGHAEQHSPQVSTTTTPPPVQRLGVQDVLDYFADKAYHIPGFRLLTIILGVNPINMRSAPRTAANILRGLVELIPGGHFISQALDNHGVFNKAGAWVEQKLSVLGDIGSDIIAGLKRFIDSLSWTDIFDLGGVWDRAKRIFTDPIKRLIDFGVSVAVEILKMVKDAILKPLAALAQGTRGYDLLKAVLGEDPITGEPVPRNADTLIGGFMKLIGQEEVWQNIKQGNAIARAWAWFQGALSGLMGMVRAIPRKIIDTLTSLTFMDILTVAGALSKIIGAFVNIATDFIKWGVDQVISLLEILFSVVAPGAVPYIAKAKSAFKTIIKNPIAFVGNLVRAGKLGFQNFANNILTHLKTALIKWITGPLGDAGVYIPKSFDLMEIIKLVLSVLGLTWQNIRGKLVKIIPEPVLVVLEKTAGILVTLVKDGPAAAWQEIKAELTELKDQMIAKITEMVTTEVVKAAVMKLVSMLNPAGAFVQAIMAIYNTITFFIQKINQIAAVVGSFIDSVAAIASGQVTAAAQKVEQTMANTLTIIIAFLAKFAGLGNIPEKVVGIIKKIRQPIDKGLDKIVGWLGGLLKKLGGKDKKDERTEAQKKADVEAAVKSTEELLSAPDADIEAVRARLPGLKTKYKLSALDIIVDGEDAEGVTVHVHAEINPKKDGEKKKRKKGTVGALKITRKSLSFTSSTKAFLIDKFKTLFPAGMRGQFKDAKLDIRHKVSISDTIKHTDAAISKLTVEQAAAALEGKGFKPQGKGRPGIIAAARELLQAANNDVNNLFIGASGKNRRKGKRYDIGDSRSNSPTDKKYDPQKGGFIGTYGFEGTDFNVTIDINVDGTKVETWEIV